MNEYPEFKVVWTKGENGEDVFNEAALVYNMKMLRAVAERTVDRYETLMGGKSDATPDPNVP